jgi:hypothetical protein
LIWFRTANNARENNVSGNNVRIWIALGTGLLLCTGHGVAGAQNAADKAAADTLFEEGKRLISHGDTSAACDKFEASLAKIVQLGTQIALASCYEKLGRTASAWAEFHAAASAAAKAHDKRQRFAEDHAAALEPRLSKIAVMIIANRVEGLEVKRDGAEVTAAEFGSPVPVDPGEHTVEASAPGRVSWAIKVTVPPTPGVVDVPVPALEKEAERPNAPPPRPAPELVPVAPIASGGERRQRRTIAYVVGGGGVGLVGVSLIFGAVARGRWSTAQLHCRGTTCDQTGVDLAGGAQTMGNLATGSFLVGAGAVAAGVFLYLTAPSAEAASSASPAALRLVPGVGPSQVGLTLQGGF